MIVYDKFWETLKKRNISTYALINSHNISSSTLTRLRHNKPLSTVTLNDLCRILNCRLDEVASYIQSDDDTTI